MSIPSNFRFIINNDCVPEVTINGKKIAVVAVTYNWATKTENVTGPNVAIVGGCINGEFDTRIFYLNFDTGLATEI